MSRVAALGAPVFVDAKLHDIPNTVAGAASRLGSIGARWVTVHASGGEEMIRTAVEALATSSEGDAGILAVTILTSLDEARLEAVGFSQGTAEHVTAMARLAAAAGAEGVVCAVPEAASVKVLDLDLIVATPGIRPAGSDSADQKRVATPGRGDQRRGPTCWWWAARSPRRPIRRRPPCRYCRRSRLRFRRPAQATLARVTVRRTR